MAKVKTDAFHRMIYNVKLLQVGKDAQSVEFHLEPGVVRANVSDGHMYLSDWTSYTYDYNPVTFGVQAPDIKVLELALREETKEEIDLGFDGPNFYAGDMMFPAHVTQPRLDEHQLLNPEYWDEGGEQVFAIMGDRFRKLSLIKPGDYPVDFKLVFHTGIKQDVLVFSAGPTVRGAIALLDREILAEKFDGVDFLW